MATISATPGPIESAIRQKVQPYHPFPPHLSQLSAAFAPSVLDIRNDSHQHRHHAPMRAAGGGAETHFWVSIVSNSFENKSTMQRHRLVFSAVRAELDAGLHSLSLQTKTEAEAAAAEPKQPS
ncbi:hypothetical protein MKEN_00695200 [Mycena kentingensis (nom. inval.)]|nr:hypothetical protein MKEN_00695200 [Mycena kentingensis (nom. inval.)]